MARIGKKQKASSKYNKIDLSPEEMEVYANASANPEETMKTNQAAIDRDNAIEEATFAANHPILNALNQGQQVSAGGTPTAPVQNIVQAKNVSAASTPEDKVNQEMKVAQEKQDIIDGATEEKPEVESVTENVTEESKPETEAKKKYNKSMMSIWDAYRNGLIDKDTAGYFTIDALANAAKNMGRSIGNVGAQFTGGSIDNGQDESMWDQRKDKIFNAELQGESESIDNYENTLKKYNLTKASTVNDLLSTVKKDIDKLDDSNPLKVAYMALAAQMANGQIDGATTLASTGGKAITGLLDLLQGKDKK